jgi:hypothetical protein
MAKGIGIVLCSLLLALGLAFASEGGCALRIESEVLGPGDEARVYFSTDAGWRESVYVECPLGERWVGNGIRSGSAICKFQSPGNYNVSISINKEQCTSLRVEVGEPHYGYRTESHGGGLNLSRWDYPVGWGGEYAHRGSLRLWGKNYGVTWKR